MNDEISELRKKADLLEKLRLEFPDLKKRNTRWRDVRVSKKVNEKPEGVEVNYACGCCHDSPLMAWFYAEREGERVYADPPEVCIGEKNPYDGPEDIWNENWQERIRKHVGENGVALLIPYLPEPCEEVDAD